MAKDPVCGMDVDEATAKHTAQHDGRTYYFCCNHCAQRFLERPGDYVK